jgi:hypothetical protein
MNLRITALFGAVVLALGVAGAATTVSAAPTYRPAPVAVGSPVLAGVHAHPSRASVGLIPRATVDSCFGWSGPSWGKAEVCRGHTSTYAFVHYVRYIDAITDGHCVYVILWDTNLNRYVEPWNCTTGGVKTVLVPGTHVLALGYIVQTGTGRSFKFWDNL